MVVSEVEFKALNRLIGDMPWSMQGDFVLMVDEAGFVEPVVEKLLAAGIRPARFNVRNRSIILPEEWRACLVPSPRGQTTDPPKA